MSRTPWPLHLGFASVSVDNVLELGTEKGLCDKVVTCVYHHFDSTRPSYIFGITLPILNVTQPLILYEEAFGVSSV